MENSIDGSWKVVSQSDLYVAWLVFFIYEVCCCSAFDEEWYLFVAYCGMWIVKGHDVQYNYINYINTGIYIYIYGTGVGGDPSYVIKPLLFRWM